MRVEQTDIKCDLFSYLSILSDLVRRSGTHGVTVHIHSGLLPQIEPDNGAVLGVDAASHFLQHLLEALKSWLTTTVDLEAWDSAEVWNTRDWIRKLLYLVKVVGHTDRLLHVPHGCKTTLLISCQSVSLQSYRKV